LQCRKNTILSNFIQLSCSQFYYEHKGVSRVMVFKKFIVIICWFVVIFQGVVQASSFDKEILNLPMQTLSGENIKLAQYIGKTPVYLKFWASWCGPCRAQMPHFQGIQQKYGDKIKVISINLGVNDDIKRVNAMVKEFKLTMSTTVDVTGKLAEAVNLIGTPYHILLDLNGNIVHKGFDEKLIASGKLEDKIKTLIANKASNLKTVSVSSDLVNNIKISSNDNKTNALFFLSTWCESYLKDRRPSMSKDCITAQHSINSLYTQYPKLNWQGIATRLWTGDKELQDYKKKFDVTHPISIDKTNKIFLNFKVKRFPTLILIKNGNELARIDDFNNQKELEKTLRKIIDK